MADTLAVLYDVLDVVHKTDRSMYDPCHAADGLASEVDELAALPSDAPAKAVASEAGDVLWYVVMRAFIEGVELSEVAEAADRVQAKGARAVYLTDARAEVSRWGQKLRLRAISGHPRYAEARGQYVAALGHLVAVVGWLCPLTTAAAELRKKHLDPAAGRAVLGTTADHGEGGQHV